MIEARNEREWIVRLQDGEDLVECLQQLGEDSALILTGIGMVRALAWGYWNGAEYEIQTMDEPCEVLSLQGNVALNELNEIIVHVHISVAGRDGVARGGHLIRAAIHNTLELGLLPLQAIALERRQEPNGLVGLFPRLK